MGVGESGVGKVWKESRANERRIALHRRARECNKDESEASRNGEENKTRRSDGVPESR